MKNLILASILIALAGCSRFSSTVTEEFVDGSKTTRVRAVTFFDSKSELAKVSAGQTDKSQRIGIGGLNQETSGTNAVSIIQGLVKIAEALPK